MGEEPDRRHGYPHSGGEYAGHRGALQSGKAASAGAVEQDVRAPGGGGEQAETDTREVRGTARPGQQQDAHPGDQCATGVHRASRSGDGDGEGAEEFQGDRQAQADAFHRGVEAEVHHAEHDDQADDRPPLVPSQPEPRPDQGNENRRGDELADRDHADRADGVEGPRAEGGAGLVRR